MNRIGVLLGLALWAGGCGNLGEPTVVSAGSRSFTARELRAVHARMDASQRPPLTTREQREEFANIVVERTLLEEYGEELSDSHQVEIEAELQAAREDMLIRRLRTLEGGGAALDSTTVRDAYDRMGTSYLVRILAFATQAEARKARGRLAAGAGLDTLAEYAGTGGQEIWASWSPAPDPVADLLPGSVAGQILGPVPSRNWWRLVEIVDQRRTEQEPYETVRPRILRGLRMREEVARVRAILDRRLTESDLHIDKATIALLAERTSDAILRPGVTEGDESWAIPLLEENEREATVAKWSGGRLTAAEYVTLVEGLTRGQRPRSAGLELTIRGIVRERVERRFLVEEARARGLESDWWVQRAIEADRSDRMIRLAVQQIERDGVHSGDPDALVQQLRETQPHLLRSDARARVLRFDLPTRSLAEAELAEIRRAGGGPQRLREMVLAPHPMPGTYHLLELRQSAVADPVLREAIFDGVVGEPSGPYEAIGAWIVVVCLGVEPPRQLSDAEIRATGAAASWGPGSIQDWIQRRRAEAKVSVDLDALDAIGPGG